MSYASIEPEKHPKQMNVVVGSTTLASTTSYVIIDTTLTAAKQKIRSQHRNGFSIYPR